MIDNNTITRYNNPLLIIENIIIYNRIIIGIAIVI